MSNYPVQLDSDDNLYLVHDALRLRLSKDYNPGDTSITVEGDLLILSRFPITGLITLTEQCQNIENRAISFSYTNIDYVNGIFEGLVLLDGYVDILKPSRITHVTQNVMAEQHNTLKDSLIAIEEFVGIKGTTDTAPFGETMEGRINFLRNIVLKPRARFTANKQTGLVPLEVEFKDLSFRLGTDGIYGPVRITWDFGDNSISEISLISNISTISATDEVPEGVDDVYVYDTDGGTIRKTYLKPGIFTVTLTVQNDFGDDICKFENYIKARMPAPNTAIIRFRDTSGQIATPGTPSNGPFEIVPKIRSPINTLVDMEIQNGENPSTPGYSYAGEILDESDNPIDPITNYTWSLGDDLSHANSSYTQAAYGIGGIYDLKLRVDTEFGAYRITTYEDAIDIVENVNLWYWTIQNNTTVKAYEYGLISETFKLNSTSTYAIVRNDSFLDNVVESDKQKQEFNKNNGFAIRGTTNSGAGGNAILYWASGRNELDPISSEEINVVEYNAFNDTYITRTSLSRPWNWLNLNSVSASFFAFGANTTEPLPNTSPTNLTKSTLDLTSFTLTSVSLTIDDFSNGAQELMQNPSLYDGDGLSQYGDFSVYRTAWKDNAGYIARNDGVGPYFRIKNFYRTEGTVGSPFQRVRKLTDIQGQTKLEGQLTNLSMGIYLFNNTGSISAFNDTSSTWSTGGPGINSVTYRTLQDTTVSGFDSAANTLQIASDSDRRAYITFDYSENTFLKYNEIDTTFTTLGSRPSGEQWNMGIF
jgi:PKD repeat protein